METSKLATTRILVSKLATARVLCFPRSLFLKNIIYYFIFIFIHICFYLSNLQPCPGEGVLHVRQEHLSGALPGEAVSEALPGDNATPRVGLPGVKATLSLALPGVKATPRVGLPGVKATLRVGLPGDKATPGTPGVGRIEKNTRSRTRRQASSTHSRDPTPINTTTGSSSSESGDEEASDYRNSFYNNSPLPTPEPQTSTPIAQWKPRSL